MNNIRIRQGASLQQTFTDTDVTAQTLTLTISDETGVVAADTANYAIVNGKAVATVQVTADYPLGDYSYMYTIVYSDGFVVKLPETDGCGDDPCELPTLTVCEANDEVES